MKQLNCSLIQPKIKLLPCADKNIQYKRLTPVYGLAYCSAVAPHWAIGCRNPFLLQATIDAASVFFVVKNNVLARRFTVCGSSARLGVIAGLHGQHTVLSMVAQAGQLSGWPVSCNAGIPTPVWATTNHECRNSGGSMFVLLQEIIIMMTTPTQPHPQYTWLFLAVRRSDVSERPHRETITAQSEREARSLLARDFVLSFAGRLPAREVTHG
ncbi:host cell division inhibitor Icd-like protein [Serratia marcescens]|uniref:host cell division inhibitor Icd-like protein n=1 Tax=Serratia marcescens TaxID=615 RepID=UPI0013DB4CFA|nr:host cell division inhibitor Icd-like protein [Serratia marcescens]